MDAVRFRRYDPRDADAVWTLHEWAMRETGTDPAEIPGTEDLRDVEGRYLDVGGEFLVGVAGGDATSRSTGREPPATHDGRVVAIGGLLPSEAGHDDERTVAGAAELHRMRVAPTHQRRGYGRALLARLEARAAELGYDRLLATTARSQPAAVAFYRDAGYDEVGRSKEAGYELVHFERDPRAETSSERR
ncbi:GNAT family N-acetyltransferase [Haloarcula nitratireducens]|uniref:GNAT family N-acetyltransferase n=1 Tax=Haloarcula nitratireducens TaxID=2487749 RepID=A0AAW4PI50_9EURY|nr:GNAT family N-acetyltransferase [Halomicroarcula nitratireducens]MBX0297191.1 GNAT family N-acetyltransferase [Halomicroarcula nitratireducens]